MPDDDRIHQPLTVSEEIARYLKMTSGTRHRPPRPAGEHMQEPTVRRSLIDNEGLELHEGNDFA
jgi:hypothetical protein